MKLFVCSVRDRKLDAFLPPFFTRSTGEATRSFQDACQDAQHQFCKHPEDYALFCIGTWTDSDAVFNCDSQPVLLVEATNLVKVVDNLHS